MVARSNRPGRGGFTLIELLVVISIIAVLMALTTAAVMRVRNKGNEVRVNSEIRQLEVDINAFKAKNAVDHLPSFGGGTNGAFRLRQFYDGLNGYPSTTSVEWQYLTRVFPGLSPGDQTTNPKRTTGLPDQDLDNNQTMMFFLTGGAVTGYTGFSTDPSRPFLDINAAPNRKGKLFDVPTNRLDAAGRYLDPWGTPYIYMAPFDGKQYSTPASATTDVIPQSVLQTMMGNATQPTGINPYRTLVTITPTQIVTKAVKEGSFQIISAGPDKIFGRGSFFVPGPPTGFNPYVAGASPYSEKDLGGDDFSNFNSSKLSVANN